MIYSQYCGPRGSWTGPPVSLIASASLAYVAYLAPGSDSRRLYSVAAVFPALNVPFAILAIESTNKFLLGKKAAFDKNEKPKPADERNITDAIEKWRDLNCVRAAMPMVATGIAIAGLLM